MHRHPQLQTQVKLLANGILAMTGVKPKHANVLELAAQLNGYSNWREAKAVTQPKKPATRITETEQQDLPALRLAHQERKDWLNALRPGDVVAIKHNWFDTDVIDGFRSNAVVVAARGDYFQLQYCYGDRTDTHTVGIYRNIGGTNYETVERVGEASKHSWEAGGYYFENTPPQRRDGKPFRPPTRCFADPAAQAIYLTMKREARLAGAMRLEHQLDSFDASWSLTFDLGNGTETLDFPTEAECNAAWAGLLDGVTENVWGKRWPTQAVAVDSRVSSRVRVGPLQDEEQELARQARADGIRIRRFFDGSFDFHLLAQSGSARRESVVLRAPKRRFASLRQAYEAAYAFVGDAPVETLRLPVNLLVPRPWLKDKLISSEEDILRLIPMHVAYSGVGLVQGQPTAIEQLQLKRHPMCLEVTAVLMVPFVRWSSGTPDIQDIVLKVGDPDDPAYAIVELGPEVVITPA